MKANHMRKLVTAIATGLMALLLASCGVQVGSSASEKEDATGSAASSSAGSASQAAAPATQALPQTGWTQAVPAEYAQASDQPGNVERVDYDSLDYAGDRHAITKTAYVYTPNGYDANADARYDVLYLMHGWGGHAGEYFEYPGTKNVFDNLIARGDMPPTIIVSATFYHDGSDTGFGGSVAELRAFHEDFENNLMPAVEGRYRTYAADTTPEGFEASRDHRAFGGFSLGSVTTWMSFCHDVDYIRYFLPMSGSCWYYGGYGDFQFARNVDFIEQLVGDKRLDERGYFIYHAVGTQDAVKSQSTGMADEMLRRSAFTPDHYVFYQKDGGYHDLDAVQEYLYNALPHFFSETKAAEAASASASASSRSASAASAAPAVYTRDTPIDEVANDPAFGNWGKLLFPVQRGYMSGATLGTLGLTWYNYIDPDMTVEVCYYLQNRAAAGEAVFIDIYSDEEKAADGAKADTGLVFFRGEPSARTAVVSAGGGFSYVGAMHDSFPHCLELSKRGYNAFALIYRPGSQTACEDLARAITYLHEHAAELGISMDGYSLWGGSAGARMAAWLGTYGTESFGEAALPRPAACIVNYTGLGEVTGSEPPTYSAVGTSDWIVDWRGMTERIERIRANGTDAEIEVFDGLPHGFGLGTGTAAEGWLDRAVRFWEKQL